MYLFGRHLTSKPKEMTMDKGHMEYVIHGKGYGNITPIKALE
jgi:hypothetical protein